MGRGARWVCGRSLLPDYGHFTIEVARNRYGARYGVEREWVVAASGVGLLSGLSRGVLYAQADGDEANGVLREVGVVA